MEPSRLPPGAPLYVLNEPHVLNASWLLFYEPHPTTLLHNLTFEEEREEFKQKQKKFN